MTEEEIVVKFTAKVDTFKKAMSDISATLKKISGINEGIKKSVDSLNSNMTKSLEKISTSFDKLNSCMEESKKSSIAMQQSMKKVEGALDGISSKNKECAESMSNQANKAQEAAQAINDLGKSVNEAGMGKKATEEAKEVTNALDKVTNKMQEVSRASNTKKDAADASGFMPDMSKYKDILKGVDNDIRRASESIDKSVQKIGESLESEVGKFNNASESIRKHASTLSELSQRYQMASNKADDYLVKVEAQEKKVDSMQTAYEKMSKALSSMNINDGILEEMDRLNSILSKNKEQAKELENAIKQMNASNYEIGYAGDTMMSMEQMKEALAKVDAESETAYNRLSKLKECVAGVSMEMLKMGNTAGLTKLSNMIANNSNKLNNLRNAYQAASIQVDRLASKQQNTTHRMEQAKTAMSVTAERVKKLRISLGGLSSLNHSEFMANLSAKVKNVGNAVSTLIHKFKNCKSAITKVKSSIASLGTSTLGPIGKFTRLGNVFNNTKSKSDRLSSSFRRMRMTISSIILSMGIMRLFSGLGESMGSLAKKSDRMNTALSSIRSSFIYLRNSIVAALEPIISALGPALSSIINKIGDFVNKIAEMFASLAGQKTYTKAVYVTEDYAASLDKTKDKADKASKAVKEYKNQLMGFDEITKLDDNSDKNNDKGGDSGSSAGNTDTGHWVQEKVNVQSDLLDAIKNGDWYKVGHALSEKINQALASIDWDKVKETAKKIATNLADFLNGAVDGLDWSLVGTTLAEGLNTALTFLDTFLTKFDFGKLGKSLATTINSFFKKTDWTLLGKTLGDLIQSQIELAFNFVSNINWKQIGSSIAEAVNTCFKQIDFSKAGNTVGTAVIGILNAISEFLEQVDWKKIGESVVKYICGIDWIGIISSALKTAIDLGKAVVDFVDGIINAIVNGLKNTDWKKVAGNIWEGLKNAWKALGALALSIGILIKDTAKALWEGIKAAWNGLTGVVFWIGAKLSDTAAGLWSWLKKSWNGIRGKAVSIAVEIGTKILGLWNWVRNSWNGIRGKAVSIAIGIGTKILGLWNWVKKSWNGIKGRAVNIAVGIGTKILGLWNWVKKSWNRIKGKVMNVGLTIGTKMSSIWNGVKKGWNKIKETLSFNVSPKVSNKVGSGSDSRIIPAIPGYQVIKKHAAGGFPDEGEMFIAREAGPEMVGTINGKTSVANNQQIVEGIESGVYKAVTAAIGGEKQKKQQFNIYVGGKQITDVVVKDINNQTIATGKSPLLT